MLKISQSFYRIKLETDLKFFCNCIVITPKPTKGWGYQLGFIILPSFITNTRSLI